MRQRGGAGNDTFLCPHKKVSKENGTGGGTCLHGKMRPPPTAEAYRGSSLRRQKWLTADMGRNEPGEPNGVTMITWALGSNCRRCCRAQRIQNTRLPVAIEHIRIGSPQNDNLFRKIGSQGGYFVSSSLQGAGFRLLGVISALQPAINPDAITGMALGTLLGSASP